jgi:hypothetical protein
VISAYNPHGKKAEPADNQTAQKMLKSEIEGMRLKYVERDGAYMGHQEKHLLVKNISRRELIRLADQFLQVAVLYGEREGEDYSFDWIEGGKTLECKKTKAAWPLSLPRFDGDKK